jgi:hypothetical protein
VAGTLITHSWLRRVISKLWLVLEMQQATSDGENSNTMCQPMVMMFPSTPSSPAPRDPVPNSVGSPTLDNLSFGMLTCASRSNTQPQWTHSSAFMRQRQEEVSNWGCRSGSLPKGVYSTPSDTPVTGDSREIPRQDSRSAFHSPFLPPAISSQSNSSSIR